MERINPERIIEMNHTPPARLYEHHPDPTACFCGKPMIKKGYGKYPYPCKAQDKHPQAMIYEGCTAGHTGWSYDPTDTQPTKGLSK